MWHHDDDNISLGCFMRGKKSFVWRIENLVLPCYQCCCYKLMFLLVWVKTLDTVCHFSHRLGLCLPISRTNPAFSHKILSQDVNYLAMESSHFRASVTQYLVHTINLLPAVMLRKAFAIGAILIICWENYGNIHKRDFLFYFLRSLVLDCFSRIWYHWR